MADSASTNAEASITHVRGEGVTVSFTPTEAVLSSSEDEDDQADSAPAEEASHGVSNNAKGAELDKGNIDDDSAAAADDDDGAAADDDDGSDDDDDGEDAPAQPRLHPRLPGAADLLNSVSHSNLSFRKKRGAGGFSVQPISLDPSARKHKVRNK